MNTIKKVLTLAYLLTEDSICLAEKKRGLGAGNWNGLGGKVEEGETIEEATVREVAEESGAKVQETDLKKVSIIEFFFADSLHLEVHAFFIRTWEGTPHETDEMKPAWFPLNKIPFELMWADDPYWLPRALDGEKLRGKVWFKDDGKSIEKMEWETVTAL